MGAPGCDDAPLVTVERLTEPKNVTMIYPYYENPKFFEKQLRGWARLPYNVLGRYLSVIVVDDGSQKYHAENILRHTFWPKSLRLFRIFVDVRWNWLAARNVGAHHACKSDWLLMTDMDHVADEKCLDAVVYGAHDRDTIYRFSRREADGKKIHPHPNSWLMTRTMYWDVGGYDEALSGHYGTDGEYRRRCAATAPVRILTDELERHEYEGDSSTTHYKRKQPEDAAAKRLIRARSHKWRPRTLSFPYAEIRL